MKTRFISFSILLLWLFSFTSCEREEPVSNDEAVHLAKEMERTIADREPDLINTIIDAGAFKRRINRNTALGFDEPSRLFQKRIHKWHLGENIITAMGTSGSYHLLRVYKQAGIQHAVFRLVSDAADLNYYDYEFVKAGDKIRVADVFVYYNGEPLSVTIGKFVKDNPDGSVDYTKATPSNVLKGANSRVSHGDYKGALDMLNNLDEGVQRQPFIMLDKMQIARYISDTVYAQYINEYIKAFPTAKNIPLLSIDLAFINRDWTKLMTATNELDSAVGHDNYLCYFRGVAYYHAGDFKQYIVQMETAYQYCADIEIVARQMIVAYLITKDYEKAKILVDQYRANHRFNQEKLRKSLNNMSDLPKGFDAYK